MSVSFLSCGDGKDQLEEDNIKPKPKQVKLETMNKRTYWDGDPEKLKESYYVLSDSQFVKHGFYKMYNDEGILIMEYTYDMGDPHGMVKDFYDDGTLYSMYSYDKGKPHGEFTWYHKNGQVKMKGTYEYGKYSDVLREYDDSGNLLKEITDFENL